MRGTVPVSKSSGRAMRSSHGQRGAKVSDRALLMAVALALLAAVGAWVAIGVR